MNATVTCSECRRVVPEAGSYEYGGSIVCMGCVEQWLALRASRPELTCKCGLCQARRAASPQQLKQALNV